MGTNITFNVQGSRNAIRQTYKNTNTLPKNVKHELVDSRMNYSKVANTRSTSFIIISICASTECEF